MMTEITELKRQNNIMKEALKEIRWTTKASNPQAMMMKGIAQKALREVYVK